MKIVEFHQPIDHGLPFDVVDDVTVFMRNDPMFYRKSFFPAISKLADKFRNGKTCDKSDLSQMVETALESYCQKYKVAELPDEIFTNDDRISIIDKIFSEEMEQIKKGEYK